MARKNRKEKKEKKQRKHKGIKGIMAAMLIALLGLLGWQSMGQGDGSDVGDMDSGSAKSAIEQESEQAATSGLAESEDESDETSTPIDEDINSNELILYVNEDKIYLDEELTDVITLEEIKAKVEDLGEEVVVSIVDKVGLNKTITELKTMLDDMEVANNIE